MKILLISNDLMPFGSLPTSGGGLRAWQIYQGLRAHGFEVIASMPAFTYLAEKFWDDIPAEQKEYLWRFGTQEEIYRRVKPDAVVFTSNWDHYALPSRLSVPLVVDLHGPRYLETKMWNRALSTERKVEVLSKADCLLAAGKRQLLYFSGWLVQGGRVPEKEHFIRYIPISLDPNLPGHIHQEGELFPHLVSGGGWFPWQNQSRAIFSIASTVRRRNAGCIDIYGGPHQRLGQSPEEDRVHAVYAKICEMAKETPKIRINGYVGRDALIEIYRRASVAVELMEYNLERELAFTTRTIEYLWCGLPVVYNDFGEVGEHIAAYDAGWCVDPTDENALDRVLDEIFSSPETVRTKSENAERLARDRFSWNETILPLVEFLRAPSKAPEASPALGPIYARPAFMTTRGDSFPTAVRTTTRFETVAVIPAENTAGVEVPIAFSGEREALAGVVLSARTSSGRFIARRTFSPDAIPAKGALTLLFPLLLQPRGGQEICLEVDVQYRDPERGTLTVFSLQRAKYPVLSGTLLSLSFLPGEASRWYHLKLTARRALLMLRNGDYKRLTGALRRRLPGLWYATRRLVPSALRSS